MVAPLHYRPNNTSQDNLNTSKFNENPLKIFYPKKHLMEFLIIGYIWSLYRCRSIFVQVVAPLPFLAEVLVKVVFNIRPFEKFSSQKQTNQN